MEPFPIKHHRVLGRVAPERYRSIASLGAWLLLAAMFFALALAAYAVPYFPLDLALVRALQSWRGPLTDSIAEAVSWPGFPPQSNVLFGTLIAVLVIRGHVLAAISQLLAAGGSAALWFAIAPMIARPRPTSDLVYVSQEIPYGSFPSGHVLNLTAGLGFAWFLAYRLLPRSWWRSTILCLIPAFLVLLGLARIYSGQHWPSDVLGGYLLGIVWLWLSVALYRWSERMLAHPGWFRHRGKTSVPPLPS